jgi:hypothetical protein
MVLCMKSIDELRGQPEANWHISMGSLPVYYLFPNIQVNCLPFGVVLVRTYPDSQSPGRCLSRIGFYVRPEMRERFGDRIQDIATNFAEVIRDEDYAVAARSQTGAESGLIEHVLFGRNEPALHHYHNTYRSALGMEPLERIEGS